MYIQTYGADEGKALLAHINKKAFTREQSTVLFFEEGKVTHIVITAFVHPNLIKQIDKDIFNDLNFVETFDFELKNHFNSIHQYKVKFMGGNVVQTFSEFPHIKTFYFRVVGSNN